LGTPWERMQPEKATVFELVDRELELVDRPAFDAPSEPVADGPPPHAVARRTRTAVAMTAAAVRAAGAQGRRGKGPGVPPPMGSAGRMGIDFMPGFVRLCR
ncbi:MAG: hypothetical protein ACRDNS_03315, partial [Trebonia sp.]